MKDGFKPAFRIICPIVYAIMVFLVAFFGVRCVETLQNGIYNGCTRYVESSIYKSRVEHDVAAIEEMLTQRKPDNIAQYNRNASNFRFSVYLDDTYMFGNSEEEKLSNVRRIEAFDPINGSLLYDVYYEVNTDFPINDSYAQEVQEFEQLYSNRIFNTVLFLTGLIGTVTILLMLIRRSRTQENGNRHIIDAVPLDLLIAGLMFIALLFLIKRNIPFEINRKPMIVSGIVVIGLMIYVLTKTIARRSAGHELWKNTLIYKMILMSAQLQKSGSVLIVYTAAAIIILLVIPVVLMTFQPMYGAIYYGAYSLILIAVCLYQFCAVQQIKDKFRHLIDGDYNHPLSDEALIGVMSDLCNDTNRIADGLKQALEKSISSERLKIELITNVSHDLKTPLTSILSYIDLLKKDHTKKQEKEYLDILQHQANRLKKITEDVLEVSKVSSGNVVIEKELTNLSELLKQAVGEYEDKLKEKQLEIICSIQENMMVTIDGRQTWRIIDNCLNNALKYSKEGTRVYLDACIEDAFAKVVLKNISLQPLNMSTDALLERFVRGDRSRNSEGSGLGLNIAQSLAQLQQGSLTISIDGDLFKVTVRLPK